MKFYDKAKIVVQSGKGGDGVVSARREAKIPYGGPSGGNGGKGGSVILQANPHINTLVDFHNKKTFAALNGEPGRAKEQYGKNAENTIIELPLGSIVRDAKTAIPLWHCDKEGSSFEVCRGGQGGIGNMHFKNAINQYPQFALVGEPGETKEIEIELQLLADVALIGTPSVGKSSLINAIANVKAKVAEYHFTTLIPNLGSVKHHDTSFNVVDVPGLIEGASSGKGLGNEFLRHIMKARILCFMLDMSRYETGVDDFAVLCNELVSYIKMTLVETKDFGDIENIEIAFYAEQTKWHLVVTAYDKHLQAQRELFRKHIMVLCNKVDAVQDPEIIAEYTQLLFQKVQKYVAEEFGVALHADVYKPYVLSTYTREGVSERLDAVVQLMHEKDGNVSSLPTFVEEMREDNNSVVEDGESLYGKEDEQDDEDMSEEEVLGVRKEKLFVRKTRVRQGMKIEDTTVKDIPFLLEQTYIEEQDAKYAKVRYVEEQEMCRLTYMIPRGNDEAEMRYWNVLDKKRILQKLLTAGLVKGDIIHVHSFYEGVDDRYVRY